MQRLAAGDTAPAFSLSDSAGKKVSLSDFANGKVIVYFYPAALTAGCTKQAVDFSAASQTLDAAGYHVVGISPDPVARLEKFRAEESLSITLLSNPELDVLKDYGAYGSKMLYGKQVEGVIRSTFLVSVDADGAGTIELAQYNVRASGHVAKLQRDLGLTP